MRRLFLFAAALVLVGLSTAFAASFATQAEDVDSFSTAVSISVPGPTPFPNTIYITSGSDVPPGNLELMTPADNNHTTTKELLLSTAMAETIELQADPAKFYAWESPVAPAQGYSLNGTVTLNLEQNGGGNNRMTAGLFRCPAAAPATTVTADGCVLVTPPGVSPAVSGGNGYLDRTVQFPNVAAIIPAGSQLRLKIVNRKFDSASNQISFDKFTISWGFLPARESKLVITP